ncbi:hypothetical protein ABG768_009817 [Culter alburnus]|uniref:Saposin B-type domain-containing protein n=1 Tax=Culter alburnus TaxID=194366 RepID=A0AAW1ZH03_CULAL
MILFAAAESSPYEASGETVQTITFKEDQCNPSKTAIKCCICLKTLKKYLPIINAKINKKINSICRPNLYLWRTCRSIAKIVKNLVIKGYFPGSPRRSCIKYKMCKRID